MFSLSEILWSTTQELSFEKAYVRRRRAFSIRERDWRRHPLYFDFEVLEHPKFPEHRKQAKRICWHWLQLELNCTHRASTLQELPNIPENARVLWLNDQVVDDPRIIYYLGRDKYDPQCIEEIIISGFGFLIEIQLLFIEIPLAAKRQPGGSSEKSYKKIWRSCAPSSPLSYSRL